MRINSLSVDNFRLLSDGNKNKVIFDNDTTIIVGRNNCGKTSLIEVVEKFHGKNNSFKFEDFSLSTHEKFKSSYELYLEYPVGEDIMIKNFIFNKAPNWFRWLLVLPISAVSFLLVTILIYLLINSPLGFYNNPDGTFELIFMYIVPTITFIYMSAVIAPKNKFITALLVSFILLFISSASLILISIGFSVPVYSQGFDIFRIVCNIIAIFLTVIYIYKNEEELLDKY